MSSRYRYLPLILVGLVAWTFCGTSMAYSQQVTTSAPFNTASNSFYEQNGINFGFSIPGGRPRFDDRGRSSAIGFSPFGLPTVNNAIQFNQGGANGVQPAFGGFQPGNQAVGGVQLGGDNFTANLGFSFGQGSSRNLVSQTPMVTTMNGQPGNISDQIQMPFVTSVTPVVNGRSYRPQYGNPFIPLPVQSAPRVSPILERYERMKQEAAAGSAGTARSAGANTTKGPDSFRERLQVAADSSAGQADLSVAEIRRRQTAQQEAQSAEALASFDKGVRAEKDGKLGAAKVFYRMAVRDATGALKQQADARLRALSKPTYPERRSDR